MQSRTASSPRRPPAVHLDVLRTPDALLGLEGEWTELVARVHRTGPFHTWPWVSTWWEVFGVGLEPWVISARLGPGGRLLAVAPMFVRRHPFRFGPFRELSLIGASHAAGDHLDVLAEPGCEWALASRFGEVLEAHRREWDVVALDRLAADSPLLAWAHTQPDGAQMTWSSVCPYLRLPERSDQLSTLLAKDARRNLTSRRRRLASRTLGDFEFQRVRSDAQLAAALDDLFRLHAPAGTSDGRRGAFRSPALRRFHRLIAQRFLARGWLRLYLLRAQGQAIAAWYGFRYGATLSLFQTGFDRVWAHCSPGLVLLEYVLAEAIAEGVREADLLRGRQPYKLQWTSDFRTDLRLRVATTHQGRALVAAYRVAYAVRNNYRTLCAGQPTGPPVSHSGE